jgi:hypothetical protein
LYLVRVTCATYMWIVWWTHTIRNQPRYTIKYI